MSGTLLLSVFALGLVTFGRLVEFDYWSTYYTRGLNYMRAYFLERADRLDKYFVLPSGGEQPSFLDQHGLVRAAGFINSVLLGIAAGLGFGSALDNTGVGLASGVGALGTSWLGHAAYVLRKRDSFRKRYRQGLPPSVERPAEDDAAGPLQPRTSSERIAKPIALLLSKLFDEN